MLIRIAVLATLVVAPVLLLAACHGDHSHDLPASGAVCPDVQTLSYQNFGKTFMDTYCVTCHSEALTTPAERISAPIGHNFDTLDLIQMQIDVIDGTTAFGPDASNQSMPPVSLAPTEAERMQLGEWLACGAPDVVPMTAR